jgi:hypothetical protein
MHDVLIFLHSTLRWFLLISLVVAISIAISHWFSDGKFTKNSELLRKMTATLAHVQLLIGLWLYVISPEVNSLFSNFSEAVKVRNVRFFAMEHSLAMVIAVVLITVGSILTKRLKDEKSKLRSQIIWFSIALLIVFMMIPWPFLSFSVHRPYFIGI